ncbi:aspartate/glutamate racemase family protein [Xanthomarina gelatinilytica]|uniref:aspartate/glutamate racemase family protein n=1 Tax=Xanthomarina gelatinilytica TaxID=1137281 RepID=UPI003AA8E3C8
MTKNANMLGILGLGHRSTLFYLDALNKAYHEEEQGYSTCPFILYNTDFNSINPYLPNQFKKLLPMLTSYLSNLEKLPISHLLIPNLTLHEAMDKLDTNLKIIHPLPLGVNFLKKKDIKETIVFGSKYTMTSTYLSNYFSSKGIQTRSPSNKDEEFIDALRQKIYSNTETLADRDAYNALIVKYSNKAHILIACTELSILNHPTHVVDMAQLQITEALKQIKQH